MSKLYGKLAAEWYRLLTPLKNYEEESKVYGSVFKKRLKIKNAQILELGSGAGHNAYYLKKNYKMTLSDLSPQMINLSKQINPDCEHVVGDMRTLNLKKRFDGVFIHDAIMYMKTEKELKKALLTAYNHLKENGVALITPDFTKESFKEEVEVGGTDQTNKSLRYLEWRWLSNGVCNVDFVYIMRTGNLPVKIENERHMWGIFSKKTWIKLIESVGFRVEIIKDNGRISFLCTKILA